MTNETFSEWLLKKIEDSGESYSELARRGGISHGRISQVLAGDKPGLAFTEGIARAFSLPAEEVFRRAGILPPEPEPSMGMRQAMHLFMQLDDEEQRRALALLRALLDEQARSRVRRPSL